MNKIEELEAMINKLKEVKRELKKKDKLSEKAMNATPRNSTPKQIDRAMTNLNFQCMHLDKAIVDFARLFECSFLDVSTEEKIYRPSGFQEYKH